LIFSKNIYKQKDERKKIIFHIYFPNTELYRKYIYKSVLRFMTGKSKELFCFLLRLKKFWKKKVKNLYLKNSSPKRRRHKKKKLSTQENL